MKVLVTGAGGFIGSNVAKTLTALDYEVTTLKRSDLNLLDEFAVQAWAKGKTFDVIIHAASRGGHRSIVDDESVFIDNIAMYYNVRKIDTSARLISFGSGVELNPTTPYARAKEYISREIAMEKSEYNLRLYGVFGPGELKTRFITSSIIQYLHKQSMYIHQDKLMDFMYIDDLIYIILQFMHRDSDTLPKTFECAYADNVYLTDIAHYINTLDSWRVGLNLDTTERGQPYIATPFIKRANVLPWYKCFGLKFGISVYYHHLKQQHGLN